MNTNAARHFISGDAGLIGFESQYAKAITELGLIGAFALLAVFACMVAAALRSLRAVAQGRWHSAAAALTAFFLLMPIHSLKGWPLDWEPANVYYWMFGAMIFALPRLDESTRAPRSVPLRELWLMQREARRREGALATIRGRGAPAE